jgi:hypothetical protein
MIAFEETMHAGGSAAINHIGEFFMGTDPVHATLLNITKKLEALGIDYAVAGALALGAHGHVRATVDVDLLVTREGHRVLRERLDGFGYVPPFAGSRNLRDTQTGVRIEFLISGEFPGDGKPKPVSFPNPADATMEIDGIHYLSLEQLIELKLASGMTNPNRLKDLADVQELIKAIRPPRTLAERLSPYVRDKFLEFWDGIRSEPPELGLPS